MTSDEDFVMECILWRKPQVMCHHILLLVFGDRHLLASRMQQHHESAPASLLSKMLLLASLSIPLLHDHVQGFSSSCIAISRVLSSPLGMKSVEICSNTLYLVLGWIISLLTPMWSRIRCLAMQGTIDEVRRSWCVSLYKGRLVLTAGTCGNALGGCMRGLSKAAPDCPTGGTEALAAEGPRWHNGL